jgi:CRISPR-associated protein Cas1
VLIVSENSRNFSLTLPHMPKNGEQKIQQYNSLQNRLGFAKYFLGKKITTHHCHLKRLGRIEDLEMWKKKVDSAESIPELLGIEGSFAALYFRYYFQQFPKVLHKGKRSKHPPLDPVNAVLSYFYTYVYHIITSKLHQAGFDPALGYLHEPFRSHNSLSSDFLELYRVQINEKVAEWFLDKMLTTDDFSVKNGVYLKYNGRKKLWPVLSEFSAALNVEINKEISIFRTAIL